MIDFAADVPAFVRFAEAQPNLWEFSPKRSNTPAAMATYVEDALAMRAVGTGYRRLFT